MDRPTSKQPVFTSAKGEPLTRFGIYKNRAPARSELRPARGRRATWPGHCRTSFAIPPPSTCWSPGWSSMSFAAGWATLTSRRRITTPRSTPRRRRRPFERATPRGRWRLLPETRLAHGRRAPHLARLSDVMFRRPLNGAGEIASLLAAATKTSSLRVAAMRAGQPPLFSTTCIAAGGRAVRLLEWDVSSIRTCRWS